MKAKILLIQILALLGIGSVFAQNSTKIDGVSYIVTGTNSVGCFVESDSRKLLIQVTIPESVSLSGRMMPVTSILDEGFAECKKLTEIVIPASVTQIGNKAFYKCESLVSIVVPNTVKRIGERAFWECKSMRSATLPDNAEIKLSEYGYLGKKGLFFGCKNLTLISGTKMMYPANLATHVLLGCENVPFYKKLKSINMEQYNVAITSVPFSQYAKERVKAPIEQWQAKKEYETTAQWRTRVTEQTRETKKNELLTEARAEYINMYAPKKLHAMIGTYDADYNIFPITPTGMSPFYVRVPLEEAEAFKTNFSSVELRPVYGIVDDKVGVLSCTVVTKNQQQYFSAESYENDATNDLALGLSPLEINVADDNVAKKDNTIAAKTPIEKIVIDNTIDRDIPTFAANNNRTFVFCIGNENYQYADPVPFAINDATVFSKYCNQTLGVPYKNLRRYKDATYGTMLAAVKDMKTIAEAFANELDQVNILFYYSGHGIPDEASQEAYLLPVDGSASQMEICYPLQRLYDEIGSLGVKSAVVFLDACFSGTKRDGGMIAQARGVAMKPKACAPTGNTIVFSAASGKQTAYPFSEKGHGLFTYFLLNKLRESKGDVTLGDLSEYINTHVKQQSILTNRKSQTPEVIPSASISTDWAGIKLK